MSINRVLLLYADDERRVQRLKEHLEKANIKVVVPDANLGSPDFNENQVDKLIADEKYIIFFVSDAISQKNAETNFLFAYNFSTNRDKKKIVIVEWSNVLEKNRVLKEAINSEEVIFPEDGLHSSQDYKDVVGNIVDAVALADDRELLYDKIASMVNISYTPGVVTYVSPLVNELCEEAKHCWDKDKRRELYKDIWKWIDVLSKHGEEGYTTEWRECARKRSGALNSFRELLKHNDFHTEDAFLNAYIIRAIFVESRMMMDIIDTMTNGDVHGPGKENMESYVARQKFYYRILNAQVIREKISIDNPGIYSEDELQLILQIDNFLMSRNPYSASNVGKKEKHSNNEDDERLLSIAEQMSQTNQLFDLICKNGTTEEFLQCLKTSYDRLMKYSEIIGAKAICAECIEHIAEINQKLDIVKKSDKDSAKAESAFKALLGFRIPDSAEYDVFISYKHEDIEVAKSLYHHMKKNLLHPFFDMYSLPELSNSEYEEAIMQALENSKHFVVILTDLKYLESFWVRLEMKTFQHEINEGRKIGANFLMVVSDEVAEQIYASNKECIHIRFRNCEIMKISEYRSKLMKYFQN